MSQGSKSAYYQAVKDHLPPGKHYREYTTPELEAIAREHGIEVAAPAPVQEPVRQDEISEIKEQLGDLAGVIAKLAAFVTRPQQPLVQEQTQVAPQPYPPAPVPQPGTPVKPVVGGLDPMKHAGVTLNTHGKSDVIRVDEAGNEWYQNEVNKKGYAAPRGRRIYRDVETGVKEETIQVGDYIETFEVPGDAQHQRPVEVKVTLPSFQTGIFKAKGMPFKIHIYQGNRGFDYDDVNAYYGAADLVPDTIKRVYVSNDLCYDMQTTIRAINDEYRERVLKREAVR